MEIRVRYLKTPFSIKQFLVDEKGNQLTGAFFDEVVVFDNFVRYRIKDNVNAVTYNFVKARSEKKDYTKDCKYEFCRYCLNFIVLINSTNNKVSILDKNGYQTTFENVENYIAYDNYIIMKLLSGRCLMVYSKGDSWDSEYIEDLSPNFDIEVFNFRNRYIYEMIKERSDLNKILKFLKLLLKEDIKNYCDKNINKYHLSLGGHVRYDSKSYNTIEEAKEEAKKVLSFVKNKFLEKIEVIEKSRADAEYRKTHKKEIQEQIEKAGEELDLITEDLNAGV